MKSYFTINHLIQPHPAIYMLSPLDTSDFILYEFKSFIVLVFINLFVPIWLNTTLFRNTDHYYFYYYYCYTVYDFKFMKANLFIIKIFH